MFNDEEGTAPSFSSNEGSDSVNAPQTNDDNSSSEPKVIYGKQDTSETSGSKSLDAQGKETTQTPAEDRKAQYAKFKEEFKDFYGADVESAIKGRFKKNIDVEKQLGQITPLLSILQEKYGEKDITKLSQRLQDEYFEAIADQKGWTAEEAKEFYQTKNENQQLKSVFHEQQEQQHIEQVYKRWSEESSELKKTYADFDFSKWSQNQQFVDLLGAGISVRQAYELCDMENIIANKAKQVEANVVSNIQAKGKRIQENGTKPTPGIVVKSSVDNLTNADLDEIERRVRAGEKISF